MKVWAVYCMQDHVGAFLQKLFLSKENADYFASQQQTKSDDDFARIKAGLGEDYENSETYFVTDEDIQP